jgi:hypothetical protein
MSANKFLKKIIKNKFKIKNKKEIEEIRSINHFSPIGITTVPYDYKDQMMLLLKNIDKEIDEFFSNVSCMDEYNERYFDELYTNRISFILKTLSDQRISHHKAILGIQQEWYSYLQICQQHIQMLDEKIKKNKEELNKYE